MPRPSFVLLLASLVPCGCSEASSGPLPAPVDFDSARAWKLLEAQVAFGPRPSGTESNQRTREWLRAELEGLGLKPQIESFVADTPAGAIQMANVFADLPAGRDPQAAPIVVLLSHFDTKRMSVPFVGANDGASSTAVLLELARQFSAHPSNQVTWRFLFVDGEESVRFQWEDPDNCYGSRQHVAQLKTSGVLARVKACVVLDLIGDRDLQLAQDTFSDRELQAIVFHAAKGLGLEKHLQGKIEGVKDDHLPFLAVDVPSLVLIDFTYGPGNAYWHTAADTLDKCAPESLDRIGRIVLASRPGLERFALARP